ncbi:hypothetical protein T492DRAFT_446600 [Pavlovales sp. CCMP2436]|nr:hypothetical protein T492DRAFT_446600 [Pavlovales sp. CCMP2436]
MAAGLSLRQRGASVPARALRADGRAGRVPPLLLRARDSVGRARADPHHGRARGLHRYVCHPRRRRQLPARDERALLRHLCRAAAQAARGAGGRDQLHVARRAARRAVLRRIHYGLQDAVGGSVLASHRQLATDYRVCWAAHCIECARHRATPSRVAGVLTLYTT